MASLPPLRGRLSTEPDPDAPILDLHREGREVDAGRGAERLAGPDRETAVVHRALDDVIDDEALAEERRLVGAEPVRGIVVVGGPAIDREGAAAMVEADHVLD